MKLTADLLLDNRAGKIALGLLLPLLVIGIVAVPLGLWVFLTAERFAKRTGRLKRNG